MANLSHRATLPHRACAPLCATVIPCAARAARAPGSRGDAACQAVSAGSGSSMHAGPPPTFDPRAPAAAPAGALIGGQAALARAARRLASMQLPGQGERWHRAQQGVHTVKNRTVCALGQMYGGRRTPQAALDYMLLWRGGRCARWSQLRRAAPTCTGSRCAHHERGNERGRSGWCAVRAWSALIMKSKAHLPVIKGVYCP